MVHHSKQMHHHRGQTVRHVFKDLFIVLALIVILFLIMWFVLSVVSPKSTANVRKWMYGGDSPMQITSGSPAAANAVTNVETTTTPSPSPSTASLSEAQKGKRNQ